MRASAARTTVTAERTALTAAWTAVTTVRTAARQRDTLRRGPGVDGGDVTARQSLGLALVDYGPHHRDSGPRRRDSLAAAQARGRLSSGRGRLGPAVAKPCQEINRLLRTSSQNRTGQAGRRWPARTESPAPTRAQARRGMASGSGAAGAGAAEAAPVRVAQVTSQASVRIRVPRGTGRPRPGPPSLGPGRFAHPRLGGCWVVGEARRAGAGFDTGRIPVELT